MAELPPAKPASEKTKAKFASLDTAFKEKLKSPAKESEFYDKSAPTTRARRARARSNFKLFCTEIYSITDEKTMYHQSTLIDYVCRFIEGMAKISEGMLESKVKVIHVQGAFEIQNNIF